MLQFNKELYPWKKVKESGRKFLIERFNIAPPPGYRFPVVFFPDFGHAVIFQFLIGNGILESLFKESFM